MISLHRSAAAPSAPGSKRFEHPIMPAGTVNAPLQCSSSSSTTTTTWCCASRRCVRASMASTHGTSNPSAEARAESSTTSRRRALGLAAASISVLLQRPQPTWAKPALLDLPACSNFKQAGPLQICELAVGAGDAPEAGDLVVVDYTARAVATGSVYDGSRGFKFTVGNGEVIPGFDLGILGDESQGVPPIRQGGSRTLLIPPELAYGAAGDGCLFGRGENCRIPPGSSVEITFRYRGLGY